MKFFWDIVYAQTKLVFNVSPTVSAFINGGWFYFHFYTVDHPRRLPGMSFCVLPLQSGVSVFYMAVILSSLKVKVKFTLEQATKAWRGGEACLYSLTSALDWGWVVSATPQPLYPRKGPGARFIGGWLGPRAGLDCAEYLAPTGIRSPDRPARSDSLYYLPA